MLKGLLALTVLAAVFGAQRAEAAWNDPVAYCRAVGTIDAPDASYTGPAVPDWMVRALMRIANAPSGTPQSAFRHAAWRCLDGRVLACSFGANIPCDEKADASRAPSRGATRFCAHHKDSVVVPAYAAGRATVFEWRCAAGDPVIARQVLNVDARGFASAYWHPVAP